MVFYIIVVIVLGTIFLNKFTSIVIPTYFRFIQSGGVEPQSEIENNGLENKGN
jgi:hypothetical protein